MKIRVTFDISEEERLVYGIRSHGALAPATREEITQVILDDAKAAVNEGVVALRKANAAVVKAFATPSTDPVTS